MVLLYLFLRSTRAMSILLFFFLNDTATPEIYPLSLHDALPISRGQEPARPRPHRRGARAGPRPGHAAHVRRFTGAFARRRRRAGPAGRGRHRRARQPARRSEEHTSELQSRLHLVCRLLLEKKKY